MLKGNIVETDRDKLEDEIFEEINKLPDFLIREIIDYVDFLKIKYRRQKMAVSLLSESSLAKDWLNTEEEKAWEDL